MTASFYQCPEPPADKGGPAASNPPCHLPFPPSPVATGLGKCGKPFQCAQWIF